MEEIGIDPDKLHKELIIQSELDFKVLTKSNCKGITFHVEKFRQNTELGKRQIRKTFCENYKDGERTSKDGG